VKVGILSRESSNYSTKRLKETCLKRGHETKVLDTLKFSIRVEKGNPALLFSNKPLKKYDAIIPRIGASITLFGAAVVRQFEQMGVYCLNTSRAITTSRDKLRAIQTLSRHNIGFPVTAFVRDKNAILPTIAAIGKGNPVVIKLLEGTQGVGVILADTGKVAQTIIETLHSAKINVLIQRFVQESKGRDIRAFVVGGKVVAAMRRIAKGDEFRSNVHRGGSVEKVTLDTTYETVAIHAAQILGLDVAGVDMLEGKDGPQLMEVNSSPGLEGIEKASSVDVAGAIVEYLEAQVLLPEIDIRQRLTLKSGYAVAEVPVPEYSDLRGKTIKDTGLKERDVLIMSIIRGSVTIPNPKGEREILTGDVLLCFGRTTTLNSLLPTKGPDKSIRTKKKPR
jgi:ribosomal protein S6--L-glutamate ligase